MHGTLLLRSTQPVATTSDVSVFQAARFAFY